MYFLFENDIEPAGPVSKKNGWPNSFSWARKNVIKSGYFERTSRVTTLFLFLLSLKSFWKCRRHSDVVPDCNNLTFLFKSSSLRFLKVSTWNTLIIESMGGTFENVAKRMNYAPHPPQNTHTPCRGGKDDSMARILYRVAPRCIVQTRSHHRAQVILN